MSHVFSPTRGLRRLIYASRFTGRPTELDEVTHSIIAKSIQNNRIVDVTGVLLGADGAFLQLLEGPSAAVGGVYERIGRDPRHAELGVIADDIAPARMFRDWNMAHYRIGAADKAASAPAGVASFSPQTLDAVGAMNLLTAVAGRHLR